MRHSLFAAFGLAALLIAGTSHAQVDYTDVKAGSMLDGKGIRIGAFVKPVPLPPGDWLVVSRNDSRRPLSGGDGTVNSTSQVTFSLKSADVGNPIYALLVSFAPDTVPVNWNGNYCETSNRAFSLTYGSGKYGTGNACASGQWYSSGLRSFLGGAPTHSAPTVREQYSALAPYAAQAPEPYATIHINARRDRGRILDYVVYAGVPTGFKPGDDLDLQTQAWVKSSAQSMIDMLENTATPIPAFPSAGSTVPAPAPSPVTAAVTAAPVKIVPAPPAPAAWTASDSLQIGSSVSKAIALEPFAKPMPLPPGQWVVVGRVNRDVNLVSGRVTSEITLTLKNADPKADMAVLVLAFNPERFNQSISSSKCDSTKFPIIEDYGTTAESDVYACTYGRLSTASLKQRVMKAATTEVEWDKKYLSPLVPYAADMPENYLWLWFTTKRADTRRLSYTLFSRVPAKVATGDKFDLATRAWIQSTGQGLMDFLRNRDSAIAGFPDTNAAP